MKSARNDVAQNGQSPGTIEVVDLAHTEPIMAGAIQALMIEAYRIEASILGVDDFVPLHRTAADVASADARFIGIFVADAIVAAAELEKSAPGHIHIGSLVVHPDHFRRGYASALLSDILEAYAAHVVTVSTGAANEPALLLYASHGFREQCRWMTNDGIPMVTLIRLATD